MQEKKFNWKEKLTGMRGLKGYKEGLFAAFASSLRAFA
jgi:hypothetical protein